MRNQFAPLWRSRVFFAPPVPPPSGWLVAKSGRIFVWRVVYWSLMLLCGDYAESVRASLAFAGLLRPPPFLPHPRDAAISIIRRGRQASMIQQELHDQCCCLFLQILCAQCRISRSRALMPIRSPDLWCTQQALRAGRMRPSCF